MFKFKNQGVMLLQAFGAFMAAGSAHAVIYQFTDLGTLGGSRSNAAGINSTGQVVGSSYTAGSLDDHAALWTGSTATDLGTLGGSSSDAIGINNAGQVVGYSYTTGNVAQHAVLWTGSTATDLGTLGGSSSAAIGVNSAGQVVGYSYTAGNVAQHAVLWNGGTATDLGTLGGSDSNAFGINSAGQVVGWAYTAGNAASHATLWNGGSAIDLNSLLDINTQQAGWVLQVATAINDQGIITGNAYDALTGQTHAYELSVRAVPEPSSYSLALLGLVIIGYSARRSQKA